MKRSIVPMMLLALFAGAGSATAHGGSRGGHGGYAAGGKHHAPGHWLVPIAPRPPPPPAMIPGQTPIVGGPPPIVGGQPPIVTGSLMPHYAVKPVPHYVYRPIVVGSAIVLAGPLLYYFFYPPGYPVYAVPAYADPPIYVDPAAARYYCPDYRDYYPNVAACPSPWLEVLPDPSMDPN